MCGGGAARRETLLVLNAFFGEIDKRFAFVVGGRAAFNQLRLFQPTKGFGK